MKSPLTSKLFTRWRNLVTGVESWVLTHRPAPVQKHFYFTNRGFSADGRYLWLACQFPPPGGMHSVSMLGVIDFERDEMQVHPDTQHTLSGPCVDPKTGEIYWVNHLDIWKRGPRPEDRPVRVNSIPKEIAGKRKPERVASHLFISADGKSLNIDCRFDNETYVGDMPLDGSPFRLWQKLDGFYDHAQFSPTDPDLIMFAHEYWQENAPFDGLRPYHRLWMIRRGTKAEPILRAPVSHSGHEWWDPDGKSIWYVHYGVGIKKVDLATREETNLWPGHLAHAYSDVTGRYLTADIMADPVISDCHVAFRDTRTGKQVDLVNRPPLDRHLTQCTHLHPHPQFAMEDQYLVYTTTVHDRVDLAIAPTGPLRERTA